MGLFSFETLGIFQPQESSMGQDLRRPGEGAFSGGVARIYSFSPSLVFHSFTVVMTPCVTSAEHMRGAWSPPSRRTS